VIGFHLRNERFIEEEPVTAQAQIGSAAWLAGRNPNPVEVAEGVWMLPGFGNTGVAQTSAGLVLVDVPMPRLVKPMMDMLRRIDDSPVHTLFVTHGHMDHAVAVGPLLEEAKARQAAPPRVIAHRNVVKRFNKYRMLAGYHEFINRIQFNQPADQTFFPLPAYNPDVTFDQSLSLSVGGLIFHAYHELGETDDHLWVWVPEKKVAFAGDMIVNSFPNVGNPFKVQRYTLEWAEGLEHILSKEPEAVVPGHGPLIQGRDRVQETLGKIIKALRYLHEEVVKRLNAGMWYEDILHEVKLLPEMMDEHFLAPRYGCPTFVVHGILRQYTGWYDGNPSNLFPPKRRAVQRELAMLLGREKVTAHAEKLGAEGREAMALQFVDIALALDLDPAEARRLHGLKAELLGALGDKEPSFIARNIFYTGRDRERNQAD
jgi:alkyl sulfatase BDS1-like metallo-beta-lactamase superfamily hydrolase